LAKDGSMRGKKAAGKGFHPAFFSQVLPERYLRDFSIMGNQSPAR